MKKLLSFALCICIAFSALAFSGAAQTDTGDVPDLRALEDPSEKFQAAFAEYSKSFHAAFAGVLAQENTAVEAQASVKFNYVTQGTEAMISGVENCPAVLHIPDRIDGYTVVSIGDKAFYKESVRELYLPRTLRYIGILAFGYCKQLRYVVMPDGLKQIDHDAFMECSALTYVGTGIYRDDYLQDVSVYLPSALEYLGVGAFCDCTALLAAVFRKGFKEIPEYCFARCKNMEVFVTYAEKLGKGALEDARADLMMFLNVLKKTNYKAFQGARATAVLYSGDERQFKKVVRDTFTAREGVYALGADVHYKARGDIADQLDPQLAREIWENHLMADYSSEDPSVLEIYSGYYYVAVGVGQARLRNPYFEMFNEYSDPDDEFPEVPAYVTVSYTWWQKLIRIFLFGWIWY